MTDGSAPACLCFCQGTAFVDETDARVAPDVSPSPSLLRRCPAARRASASGPVQRSEIKVDRAA
jgi:hypothetical protein